MTSQKLSTTAIIIIVVAMITVTVTAAGLLSSNQTVPLSGTINAINVGVYSDEYCNENCTALSVGNINPGDTVNQTIYIKNTGNAPVTLSMASSNWSPAGADSYLTLSWNRESYVLGAGLSVNATLTLTAESDTGDLTTFSCDVTITGTQ